MFAFSSFISTMLLIPACAIGAGLFSFPIITGLSGFMPGSIAIMLTWVFSTFIGLLIADLSCSMNDNDVHFFSLTSKFLSKRLQYLTLCSFLFICYGSLIGYIDGMVISLKTMLPLLIDAKLIGLILILCLMIIINKDKNIICNVTNILLPVTLIIYVYFSYLAYCAFNPEYLKYASYDKVVFAFPTLVTAFSFQLMIPSMSTMLNGNRSQLRAVILIGTALNCVMYLVWYTIMLGINPIDNLHIAFAQSTTLTASIPTSHTMFFQILGNVFAFVTMLTSFTSISISMKDYWHDALMRLQDSSAILRSIGQNKYSAQFKKYIIQFLIFTPIILIFLSFKQLFLWVFSSTGGYGDAIAFGLMPIYMSYIAIKYYGAKKHYPVILYILATLFFGMVFFAQVYSDLSSLLNVCLVR